MVWLQFVRSRREVATTAAGSFKNQPGLKSRGVLAGAGAMTSESTIRALQRIWISIVHFGPPERLFRDNGICLIRPALGDSTVER